MTDTNTPVARIKEFLRQWPMAAHKGDVIYGVFHDPQADGVDLKCSDIQALIDMNAELLATIDEMSTDPSIENSEYMFGLRCGVEDMDIHDRYEAAEYGWSKAFSYVEQFYDPAKTKGGT